MKCKKGIVKMPTWYHFIKIRIFKKHFAQNVQVHVFTQFQRFQKSTQIWHFWVNKHLPVCTLSLSQSKHTASWANQSFRAVTMVFQTRVLIPRKILDMLSHLSFTRLCISMQLFMSSALLIRPESLSDSALDFILCFIVLQTPDSLLSSAMGSLSLASKPLGSPCSP